MTNFTISTTVTTSQALTDGETGVIGSIGLLATSGTAISGAGNITVMNFGSIAATTDTGIQHNGTGFVLDNSGTVQARLDGVNVVATGTIQVMNSGAVLSNSDALDLRLTATGGTGQIRVNNSGVLQGFSDGIVLGAQDRDCSVVNTGTITGTRDFGLALDTGQGLVTAVVTVSNSGTIGGGQGSLNSPTFTMRVLNSGTMLGDMRFGQGDDLYDGSQGVAIGVHTGGDGNDTLISGNGAETFFGGSGNDRMIGNGGADFLSGDSGNDFLSGGDGDDTLDGGIGNDDLRAGIGDDEMRGGDGADTMRGDLGQDLLIADANDDIINGGQGADTIYGGDGNDILIGGEGADYIDGGAGTHDRLQFSDSPTGLRVDLEFPGTSTGIAAGDTYVGIEDIFGTYSEDGLFGDGGNNQLVGAGGNDTLDGRNGNDVLNGGVGNDVLTGGAGNDVFIFDSALGPTNVDDITDYVVANDTIYLQDSVFIGLSPGFLSAAAFAVGAAATTAAQRIIYNAATGDLLYDADGNGAVAAVRFATLDPGLALTNTEFFVI